MKQQGWRIFVTILCTLWLLAAGYETVAAQPSIASSLGVAPYPSRGQSPAQQNQDEGAAGGAIIGSIAGDTSDGAGVGAVVGTLAGGRQARQNRQARAQEAQNAQAATIQQFNRAFGACMEGRGYAVR
jgi:uncharacterized membrane protein